MKKFAKISLAAAVAVAGLSTVANAKPLEEAIKGVDATGYVTYQYNDKSTMNNGTNSSENIYKAGLTLSVPAADDVAVKVTGVVRGVTTTADANVNTQLAHANFVYTGVQNLSVIAGKQALNTPWTEGSSVINPTQNGTGALALYNAGFATIAAGHFTNNSINGITHKDNGGDIIADTTTDVAVDVRDADITVVAAIVPLADIATAQVWYGKVGSTSNNDITVGGASSPLLDKGLDVWSFNVAANLMDIAKLDVRHSTLETDDSRLEKQKLTKAVLSGAAGPVNLAAGYATTGKDGGLVAFDKDADAAFTGYQLTVNGLTDADAYLLSANMNVMPSLNLGVTYIDGDCKDGTDKVDFTETYAQLTYTHNKNLSAYVRFGNAEMEKADGKTLDTDAGRLQIGYKF